MFTVQHHCANCGEGWRETYRNKDKAIDDHDKHCWQTGRREYFCCEDCENFFDARELDRKEFWADHQQDWHSELERYLSEKFDDKGKFRLWADGFFTESNWGWGERLWNAIDSALENYGLNWHHLDLAVQNLAQEIYEGEEL